MSGLKRLTNLNKIKKTAHERCELTRTISIELARNGQHQKSILKTIIIYHKVAKSLEKARANNFSDYNRCEMILR